MIIEKIKNLKKEASRKIEVLEDFIQLTGTIVGDIEKDVLKNEFEKELKEAGLYDEIDEDGYIKGTYGNATKINNFCKKYEYFHGVSIVKIENKNDKWVNFLTSAGSEFALAIGNRDKEIKFEEGVE